MNENWKLPLKMKISACWLTIISIRALSLKFHFWFFFGTIPFAEENLLGISLKHSLNTPEICLICLELLIYTKWIILWKTHDIFSKHPQNNFLNLPLNSFETPLKLPWNTFEHLWNTLRFLKYLKTPVSSLKTPTNFLEANWNNSMLR